MAVSTSVVEYLTGYVLGVDYLQAEFDLFKTLADSQVLADAPNMSSSLRDVAAAYLIGHRIFLKLNGKSGFKSENFAGEYSYSRDSEIITTSTFFQAYKDLLRQDSEAFVPSAGVTRTDSEMSKSFRLTRQKLPTTLQTDSSLEEVS